MSYRLKKAQKYDNFSYVEGACDVCQTNARLTKVNNKWVCPRHRRIEENKPIAKQKQEEENKYKSFFDYVKTGAA